MQTQNQNYVQFTLRQMVKLSKMQPYFNAPDGMWAQGYAKAQEDMKQLISSCLSLVTDADGNLLPVEQSE